MSYLTYIQINTLVLLISTTLILVSGRTHIPPPFLHKPKIPPSVYHGENQKYLTIPGVDYYPPAPPPPPGFSSYGIHSYKDKSDIQRSEVSAGLAFQELLRNKHHHQYYGIQNSEHTEPTYHDVVRERYTTKFMPIGRNIRGLESHNILEMTNYVMFDNKSVIFSSEGNLTCISMFNATSIGEWHNKQLQDFKKQFPTSVYPLYRLENYTKSDNFTIFPGRIIHREPVSITCCGSSKEKLNLNFFTDGRHSDVNCLHQIAHIPVRKLWFFKIEESSTETTTVAGDWHQIELKEPN